MPSAAFDFLRLKVVDPEGLEPPTPWFEAKCSIQLSYGSTKDSHDPKTRQNVRTTTETQNPNCRLRQDSGSNGSPRRSTALRQEMRNTHKARRSCGSQTTLDQ